MQSRLEILMGEKQALRIQLVQTEAKLRLIDHMIFEELLAGVEIKGQAD